MKGRRFPIGLRTIKSALAIILSLVIVEQFGASTSKVIFALIGAASAMETTFKASLKACFTQIGGVTFGALFGIAMLYLPIDRYIAVGIGFILITTFYNSLHLTLSPVLPCIIIATVLTNSTITPATYVLGRLWDTTIGLAVGFTINMIFFPYDNRGKIRSVLQGLDKDIIQFLEDLFDGDEVLPKAEAMKRKVEGMEKQLALFANQRLIHHRKERKADLSRLRSCDETAKHLMTELEALSLMERPGRLTALNRERLERCGAIIRDQREAEPGNSEDIVTNYHVTQILALRRELREELEGEYPAKG